MWRNRTKSRLYILIQNHTVVSAFVKFGNVTLEDKELLLRILRKTLITLDMVPSNLDKKIDSTNPTTYENI